MTICKNCGKDKQIKNKHFGLCYVCNKKRLSKKNNGNKIDLIKEDEDFYEKCFNSCKKHNCEECGKMLPEIFRSFSGKVIAKWRYSHIVPKSINKNLRHDEKNINHLCLNCHQRWENGDKKNMNIYEKNKKKFPWFFK